MEPRAEPVLVLCNDTAVGTAVGELLRGSFSTVHVWSDPERGATAFDEFRPALIVFALPTIREAERCYLGLFREAATITARPHRTILLCSKDEIAQAYEECRRGRFDDYVLYWPVAHDMRRLSMSAHLAVRSLETALDHASSEVVGQLMRQLDELSLQLDRLLAQNHDELRRADESLKSLASGLVTAVKDASSSFADRISKMPRGASVTNEVKRHLKALDDDHLGPHLARTAGVLDPARKGLVKLSDAYHAGLESARRLANDDTSMPSILVVEDEPTQREVYRHLLGSNRYAVSFAATASDALRIAMRSVPDLIVMDIELPDVNGVELTRELKRHPQLADVPVIMITGHRERNVVVQSREAGAVDFLIKPFTPRLFMQKLERHLHKREPEA